MCIGVEPEDKRFPYPAGNFALVGGLLKTGRYSLLYAAIAAALDRTGPGDVVFLTAADTEIRLRIFERSGELGELVDSALFLLRNEFITGQVLLLPLIGLVFVIEAGSVIVQVASVKLRGKRVFKMSPLHHHFELIGWDEEKITLRFWIIGALSALIGVAFYMATVGLLS